MADLDFDVEWEHVEGSRGEEIRATWARVSIRVDDTVVTEVYDGRAKSVRERILIPLYPLAEWIATHWWSLLYEPESPVHVQYARRHNLRHGREGFAFPNLVIEPIGERAIVEWRPLALPAERLKFAGAGTAVVPLETLRERLAALVTMVVDRLEVQGVAGTLLQEEWEAVVSTGPEEAAFCVAVARLGGDPYGLADALRDAVLDGDARLPEEWKEEFFSAARASSLSEQVDAVMRWREAIGRNGGALRSLRELRDRFEKLDPRRAPWEQGYAVARRLRHEIGLGDAPVATDEALTGALNIPQYEFARVHEPVAAPSFDALIDVFDEGTPGFLTTKQRPEQVRFAFARALFEYLTSEGRPTGLLTSARTERQKRNRAFGAELLAPAVLLRNRLSGEQVDLEELDELALDLGVSTPVVMHQVENHDLATIAKP